MDSHTQIKMMWMLVVAFRAMVLVPLSVFSLKTSAAGSFAVAFRVLSQTNVAEDNVLLKNGTSYGR